MEALVTIFPQGPSLVSAGRHDSSGHHAVPVRERALESKREVEHEMLASRIKL